MTAYGISPPCRPCQDEQNRWLDTTPQGLFPNFGYVAQGHVQTSYGMSPRGLREARHMRWERWRDTVRFQRDLIARTCRDAGHAPAAPRIVQLDILDLFGEAA